MPVRTHPQTPIVGRATLGWLLVASACGAPVLEPATTAPVSIVSLAPPRAVATATDEGLPPEPADPPGEALGTGKLIVAAPSLATPRMLTGTEPALTVFGRGVIVHQIVGFPDASCPVLDNPACQVIRFAPWKDPAVANGAAWRREVEPALGPWGPLRPAPRAWLRLAGGGDRHVFGLAVGGHALTIDVIDENGALGEPYVLVGAGEELVTNVVELADRIIVTSTVAEGFRASLWRKIQKVDGVDTSLVGEVKLPLRPDFMPKVQSVAAAGADGLATAMGHPWATVLLDAKGRPTNEWALIWTELSLSGAGLSQTTHVAKLDGEGRRGLSKRIDLAPLPIGPDGIAPAHTVAPLPGGSLRIDGFTFGPGLARSGARKARIEGPHVVVPPIPSTGNQVFIAAAYDERSSEGLVLVAEQSSIFDLTDPAPAGTVAVRFSALGAPLGPPVPVPLVRSAGDAIRLVRASDGWMVITNDGGAMVTGPRAGAHLALGTRPSSIVGVVQDGATLEIFRTIDGVRSGVESLRIDGASVGAWTPLPSLATTRVRHAGRRAGDTVFVGQNDAGIVTTITRDRSGAFGPPRALASPDADQVRVQMRRAWGRDVALVRPVAPPGQAPLADTVVTWLGDDVTARTQSSSIDDDVSPILSWTGAIVGTTPGQTFAVPSDLPARGECRTGFATGRRRVVLVCERAVEADRIGTRVGFRVVRY